MELSPKSNVKRKIACILAVALLMNSTATCACSMPSQRSKREKLSAHSPSMKKQLAVDV